MIAWRPDREIGEAIPRDTSTVQLLHSASIGPIGCGKSGRAPADPIAEPSPVAASGSAPPDPTSTGSRNGQLEVGLERRAFKLGI